jgi:hypothetical protein
MSKSTNLKGQSFGRWIVLSEDNSKSGGKLKMLCGCVCGVKKLVRADHLRSGGSRSCGCLNLESIKERSTSHGLSGTPEYKIWSKMKTRCLNKNNDKYHRYGGRGISVCDKWLSSVEAFVDDMGERPSIRHSIDRINNNGNYEPKNCRWATHTQQMRNRNFNTVTHDIASIIKTYLKYNLHTQKEIAEICGVSKYSVSDIKRGKSWGDVSCLPV